jgi:hypothetical protein
MAIAAGMLASCGGTGSGTGATPGPAAAAAAAGLCAGSRGPAGGGPRQPALPQPGSLIVSGQLNGVAALSAASVWAVGSTIAGNAVSMHWGGSTWTQVLTPYGDRPVSPAGDFAAVSAVSARDIWAVGSIGDSPVGHWDGREWSPSPAPHPGGYTELLGVAAVSAADVWAVGGRDGKTVILHWNGAAWTQVPSPAPAGRSAELYGVAAVSAASAWAVGQAAATGGTPSTAAAWPALIEHWNGTAWTLVPSPAIPGGGTLAAVSASSPRNAWAVGGSGGGRGLIEHWDGRAWTLVPSPDLGAAGVLRGVTIAPDGGAWAVGGAVCPRQGQLSVIEHWDGRAWRLVPSPASGILTGVAAASPDSAWAVGSWSTGPTAIIEHWNGTAWTWPPGFCAAPSGPGCNPPGTSSSSPLPANTYAVPSPSG